jgi:hypothetical protein
VSSLRAVPRVGDDLARAGAGVGRYRNIITNPDHRPWLGELDDLRVYDCSLEADGVAALLEQP